MATEKNRRLKSYGVTLKSEGNDTVITSNHVVLEGLALLINVTKTSGCYLNMLEIFKGQLDAMLSYHGKVSVYRFDVHFPDADDGERANKAISGFFKRFVGSVTTVSVGLKRVGYFWCVERKEGKLHYHAVIMINANQFKNITTALDEDSDEVLTVIGEKLSWAAEKTELSLRETLKAKTFIRRNRPEHLRKYLEVIYQCSYLAKQRTKEREKLGKSINRYGSSQLEVNPAEPLPFRNPPIHEAKSFAPLVFKGDRWVCIHKQYREALVATEKGVKEASGKKSVKKRKSSKRKFKKPQNRQRA